jgi:hypothetical protein
MTNPEKKINFLKAWFLFFLVSTVIGIALVMGVGILGGAVLVALGIPAENLNFPMEFLTFPLTAIVSFFIYRWSVKEYILEEGS